jgi:Major capsid protein N-terminus/Large eukaryotic DNA virus major capsid protein
MSLVEGYMPHLPQPLLEIEAVPGHEAWPNPGPGHEAGLYTHEAGPWPRLVNPELIENYTTNNPSVTYFRSAIRRHTAFAPQTSTVRMTPTLGSCGLGFGATLNADLDNNGGDILSSVFLCVRLPSVHVPSNSSFGWLDHVGYRFIEHIEVSVGNESLDCHTGEYMFLRSMLMNPSDSRSDLDRMIGNVKSLTDITVGKTKTSTYDLCIPLQFHFCDKKVSCGIKVCALQHPVRIKLRTSRMHKCLWRSDDNVRLTEPITFDLRATYFRLSDTERARFRGIHEDTFRQMNMNVKEVSGDVKHLNMEVDLFLSVAELMWVVQRKEFVDYFASHSRYGTKMFNYTQTWTDGGDSPLLTASIKITPNPRSKNDRLLFPSLREQRRDFFERQVPWQYYKSSPPVGVGVYTFAIDPQDAIQSTGALMRSEVETMTLSLNISPQPPSQVRMFHTFTNVYTIQHGFICSKYRRQRWEHHLERVEAAEFIKSHYLNALYDPSRMMCKKKIQKWSEDMISTNS